MRKVNRSPDLQRVLEVLLFALGVRLGHRFVQLGLRTRKTRRTEGSRNKADRVDRTNAWRGRTRYAITYKKNAIHRQEATEGAENWQQEGRAEQEGTHDEAQRGEQFLAVLAQLLHQHRQTPADSADPECERRRQRRTEKLKPEAKRAQLGG